ncbi:MAG: hypothetical protein IJT31_07820, partial [Oscillibacter sp.]|nr:hypothetical protein [Oscillibacter sp.]
MMKRRTLLLLVAVAALAALLTACGGGTTPAEDTATPDADAAPEVTDAAPDSYECQLIGTVTDAGEVVSALTIDFGEAKKVTGVDNDTFTVHATASTEAFRADTDLVSFGDYDIDRAFVKTEDGQTVTLYFDESEGATLAYTSGSR